MEQRIFALEGASQPLELTVNCPEESVGEALEQAAGRTGHVTITIEGVCTERVRIARDNITLRGAATGDGLQAPSPEDWVLTLDGARNINLRQLTITGGTVGLHATDGATFSSNNLHISGAASQCVYINMNALGMLTSPTLANCNRGLNASWGGSAEILGGLIDNAAIFGVSAEHGAQVSVGAGAVIRNSWHAVSAENGGAIEVWNATIENNDTGAFAFSGGHVRIDDGSIIQNTTTGVGVHGGGTVYVGGGTIVANNQGHGVGGRAGGTIILFDAIIENNGNDGVSLGGGATADISNGTIVRNNIGHGISLGATSSATFFDDTVQVTGNTGTAVICGASGLDDVALIVGEPGVISGNGSDTIECPRGFP